MKKLMSLISLWVLAILVWVPGTAVSDPHSDILDRLNEIQDELERLPPTWSKQLPASARFVVLADFDNQAVLDRETGLVWERYPEGRARGEDPQEAGMTWVEAVHHCHIRETGGRKGWRLPTVVELLSVTDPNQSDPALPNGHPFTSRTGSSGVLYGPYDKYWSATTHFISFSSQFNFYGVPLVKSVWFGSASINNTNANVPNLAWCVRGGNNSDPFPNFHL